jgi:hypothetical protein
MARTQLADGALPCRSRRQCAATVASSVSTSMRRPEWL